MSIELSNKKPDTDSVARVNNQHELSGVVCLDDKPEGLPAAILTYEFVSAPTAGAAGNLRAGNEAVVFYGDVLQAHNLAHDYIHDLKMKYKHTLFDNIIIVSVLNNDSINIIHTEKSE